jgi:hypothetical protein
MTSASGGVAVIATQVARTDRRALSEAWYSALHLAHAASPARAVVRRAPAGIVPPARGTRAGAPHDAAQTREAAAPALRAVRDSASGAGAAIGERRHPVCETARRIERAVTALRARASGDAAQTVEVAGGRVRLLVRSDRGTTRIVALCSDPLREPVERALARARFTLAAAGHDVGAS